LADEFGISRQHVGRLVRGEQRPVIARLDREALCDGVSNAMDAFLSRVELDAGVAVLAVTAQALAAKLDECVQSDSATAAQAVPRIASQLVDVIDRLRGAVPQEMDSLDRLKQRREARLLAMSAANGNGTRE
jgi:hypothetical protein